VPILVISDYSHLDIAKRSLEFGANDYLIFPAKKDSIMAFIREAKKKKEDERKDYIFYGIVGKSKKIKSVIEKIKKVAIVDVPVLIIGESGTGKELVADAIHFLSARRNKPFIKINCAGFTESLLTSELFGYEKGAFTGAYTTKKGYFELADKGTIFLDEVGDMSISLQVKLLRVLETGEFYRVGGTKPIKVDVRHISATNQNLESLIREGKFREDLYYRLRVVKIELPPLRERKDDIPLLVKYFIDMYNEKYKKEVVAVSEEVMNLFLEYPWPGNIRELKNLIEGIVAIIEAERETITIEDIPDEIRYHDNITRELVPKHSSPIDRIEKYEKKLIEDFLHVLRYYISRKKIFPSYVGELESTSSINSSKAIHKVEYKD